MASKRKHEYKNSRANNRALNREAWERSGAGSHGKFGKDKNRSDRRKSKQKGYDDGEWL